jgi:2-amino-4-hydroxy-6-hydroxymethyldihydropteridine diphosphokinase
LSAVESEEIHSAVIGIGSNIFPKENIRSALYLLSRMVTIRELSRIWKTAAVGSPGPDFLNAAVLISSAYSSNQLRREVLRPIENLLGRVRTHDPNAPRTIDLDILIFDDRLLDEHLWEYPHMAVPVGEIMPDFVDRNTGEQAAEIAGRLIKSPDIVETELDLHWIGAAGDII